MLKHKISQKQIWILSILISFLIITVSSCGTQPEPKKDIKVGFYVPPKETVVVGQEVIYEGNCDDAEQVYLNTPMPDLWLETLNEKTKIELPSDVKGALTEYWKTAVAYRYDKEIIHSISTFEADSSRTSNVFDVVAKAERKLVKTTLKFPNTERNITDEEAGEIIKFISRSAEGLLAKHLVLNCRQ